MPIEDQADPPRSAKSWIPNDYQAPAGVTDSFCGHQDAGTTRHASDLAPIVLKAKHMLQVLDTRSFSLQGRLQLAPGLGYFGPG
jgi:hypothetical protein